MFETSFHELKSVAGEMYRVSVAAPTQPAPEAGWPVVYLVDGDAWAPLAAATIVPNVYFSVRSRMVPAVVVGIGYPTEGVFDVGRRHHDLTTPTTMASLGGDFSGSENGGFEAMLQFLEEGVKPVVEGRVRINRQRQTLGGHSLGGLFTLRVLIERPQAFQTYLALSPSIWWDHASMVNDIANRIAGTEFGGTRIYLGVGELEEFATPVYAKESEALIRRILTETPALLKGRTIEAYLADMDAFTAASRMVSNAQQAARLLAPSVAEVRCDVFPDEDHFSVVPAALGRGLAFALQA